MQQIKKAAEAFLREHLERNRLPEPLRARLAVRAHENRNGCRMDIRHPKAFQEKLLWYQLHYRHEDLGQIVDKYRFKQYLDEKLGPGCTVPMLGVWDSAEAFRRDWERLPESFCLKSTLQYGGRGIRVIRRRSEEDLQEMTTFVRHFLNPRHTLINSYYSVYDDAVPRIMAEQLLEPVPGRALDYKVFCFSGEPYILSFCNFTWSRMDEAYEDDRQKPLHFEEMKALAKTLSKPFPFVRVDFFNTTEKLYVAELTFNPGVGNMKDQPEAFYMGVGELLVLPEGN